MIDCYFLGFVKVGLSLLLGIYPKLWLFFIGIMNDTDNLNLASTGHVKRESPIANTNLSWAGIRYIKSQFLRIGIYQPQIQPWEAVQSFDGFVWWNYVDSWKTVRIHELEREEKNSQSQLDCWLVFIGFSLKTRYPSKLHHMAVCQNQ